jgi:chitin synthase
MYFPSYSVLTENPILRSEFFDSLPGGISTFMVYKWLVVSVIAMYAIPIIIYALFYCKWEFMFDVVFGAFAFVFYTPTYLNILNTFALCRIDDISWGTKGLDA